MVPAPRTDGIRSLETSETIYVHFAHTAVLLVIGI